MTKLARGARTRSCGFTLLEVLLVVGVLGVLTTIVIFALNPAKQLADARNAQRKLNVNSIINAVYQYSIDNGAIPSAIPTTTATAVCKTGAVCTGLVDLSVLTLNQKYLVAIPFDPASSTANSSGYTIIASVNGRVTVAAPAAENGAAVSVTR